MRLNENHTFEAAPRIDANADLASCPHVLQLTERPRTGSKKFRWVGKRENLAALSYSWEFLLIPKIALIDCQYLYH
ncbi:hypothetical protein TNCV_1875771 [Trichonephila clavipes]|nr:hypothetical protein TNCV_1875771 [Trichonephila clavipes]